MNRIKKYTNIVETFLQSESGQRFFNIAFSLGAAIVIWGALFMILNLPGGRTLLCIGMGTEIAMFILTAFERPSKEPYWGDNEIREGLAYNNKALNSITIIDDLHDSGKNLTIHNTGSNSQVENTAQQIAETLEKITSKLKDLNEAMAAGNTSYAQQISELNRNISGLNSLYELQLKNVSGQLTSMSALNEGLKDIKDMYEKSATDSARYCEETEKMTQYMKQINDVYARMISALQVNRQ